MPILVRIGTTKEVVWKDTTGVVWKGRTAVEWKDRDGVSTLYLSLEDTELDHFWDGIIESFSSPQYSVANDYGGFVELGFGQISFSPDVFVDDWPPPKQLTLVINYTDTTESEAVLIFSGDIRLESFADGSVSYDIRAPKYAQRLLDEAADYAGDTVPYPRAFGVVTHVSPLRIADNAGRPTYHLGGISTSSTAVSIIAFDSSTSGTKTKVTTGSAHGWSSGASITITGTDNFDATHVIESASGSSFVIPVTFPTDNSETLPIHASAYSSGGFSVYDDGMPIQENVVIIGDGSFALTANLVGEVTISGTGSQTTLLEVITWGQGQLAGINSIVSTNARATSPDVSYWATSQVPVIDFMSDIAAFFTHFFYITDDVLTLGDMLINNGTRTLTEHDYFDATYSIRSATSQVKAFWETYSAFNGFVDEVRTARYVKTTSNTVIESLYTISSGSSDSTSLKQLPDSTATFLTDGIKFGHVVQNTTDDTRTTVIAVSETSLDINDDIFVSGEGYVVGPSFPYGQELTVEPYHDTKSNVSTALQNILSVLVKDVVEVTIPLTTSLPVPGEKVTFPDTSLRIDTTSWLRARDLIYNFEDNSVIIIGEGVIS